MKTIEQLVDEVKRNPEKRVPVSSATGPQHLDKVYGTFKTAPLTHPQNYSDSTARAVKSFCSDTTIWPVEGAWFEVGTIAPGEYSSGPSSVRVKKLRINPSVGKASYFAALSSTHDFDTWIRLIKLYPAAGVRLSRLFGVTPEWAKNIGIASGNETVRKLDKRAFLGWEDQEATTDIRQYALAVAAFPELYLWDVLNKERAARHFSMYEDEAGAHLLFSAMANRIKKDAAQIYDLIYQPEPVTLIVEGKTITDIPVSIPRITVGSPVVPWLPSPMTIPEALRFAMERIIYLLETPTTMIGARAIQLSTPGTVVGKSPLPVTENAYMIFDAAQTAKTGQVTFQNIARATAHLMTPKTVVIDPADASTAFMPRAADFAKVPELYDRTKRLPDGSPPPRMPDDEGSILPWVLGGVAAAAAAFFTMKQ